MSRKNSIFIYFASLCVGLSASLNVLINHPYGTGSHMKTLYQISQELVSRGHRVVTVRMADEYTFPGLGPNYTQIVLPFNNTDGDIPYVRKGSDAHFVSPLSKLIYQSDLSLPQMLWNLERPDKIVSAYCHQLLGNQALRQRLESMQFDVSIVDLHFNDCGLALVRSLNVPAVIGFWSQSFTGQEADLTVAELTPTAVPYYTTQLPAEMNLIQRLKNLLMKTFMWSIMVAQCIFCDRIIQEHVPGSPSMLQMIADLNGFLINSHPILDVPRLQPETFINVGGLQFKRKLDPLPKDIEDFMNGGAEGVILVALGFGFNDNDVPEERIHALMTALGRLPQRVIARLKTRPANCPSNVLVRDWLPQQEILAHEKTILFFTHFGMHGALEAVWYAVPMVGIPMFSDQGDVRTRVKERGIGEGIGMYATSQEIYDAIVHVRDDPKYSHDIRELSALYRRQLRHHPMDDAIWLIGRTLITLMLIFGHLFVYSEYLADTKGAPHQLLPARNLNIVQYYMIDLLVIFIAGGWVLKRVLKTLVPYLRINKAKLD